MRSRAPPNFTGHLRFWMQKYLVQNWQELFTRTKFAVIIFRNFMKLSRWKRKMKIWENCNANGKMTKNKRVSYWTRDISSRSLEEKLHWYNITHGVNSSLLIQSWQELFIGKKLSVIIFRYFMKLSRWERKIKIWENCNANGKMTKNKCVSYWTRDISSWSLEEKLHWYNITHGVNSSLSIQLWQSVTCTSLRRKGIFLIARVLHWKGKSWI